MVYLVTTEDKLCLWWDRRQEFKAGCKYKITINDKFVIYTEKDYYDIQPVEGGSTYTLSVQLVDENDNVIGGRIDTITGSTLIKKEKIDLTLPPYNAVGDAKTDNTAIIQKALDECDEKHYLYLPYGVYICDKITTSGDKKIVFGAGATICTKDMVNKI